MNFRLNKKMIAAAWMIVLAAVLFAFIGSGLSLEGLVQAIKLKIDRLGIWGPMVYVIGYSLRSLVFFPASVLSALGGMLFGPWLGILLTLVGENISANLSFIVGRYFGGEALSRSIAASGIVTRLACGIQQNGFMAVMSMRLMYLPFDLVGYGCGVCSIRQRDFALGTLLGTVPGLATFVFLGSAAADYGYLLIAGGAVAFSFILARYFKRKEKERTLSAV
jgi:uncharacterized membrane protein YdjX (TVP38/TMEM64 family)